MSNLLTSSENISWARFNTFLVANSILILAWMQMYNAKDRNYLVMAVLAILGILGGFFWSGLSLRGRRNIILVNDIGEEIEKKVENDVEDKEKVFTEIGKLRERKDFRFASSTNILCYAPIVFSIFYVILLYFSLKIWWKAYIVILITIGLLIYCYMLHTSLKHKNK